MAVTLDPVLLSVLACPADDHAPLTPGRPDDPEASALTCTECGRIFPIRDGIPVLLLDDAEGGPEADRAAEPGPGPDRAQGQDRAQGPDDREAAGTDPPGIAPGR